MKMVEIKAQPTTRAKSGGALKIKYHGQHHVIKAVVFSRQEAEVLRKAADNATIVKNVEILPRDRFLKKRLLGMEIPSVSHKRKGSKITGLPSIIKNKLNN